MRAVLGYAHVPIEERDGQPIEWVEELVIGDEGAVDAGYGFGRPTDVAVDPRGRIYVVDRQSTSVHVFDADGEFLRPLGREGQGPGEFQDPDSVVALDDRVIVTASRNGRLSHFDLDGNHIEDHPFPVFDNLGLMVALPGGEVVSSTLRFTDAEQVEREFAAYSPEGATRAPRNRRSTSSSDSRPSPACSSTATATSTSIRTSMPRSARRRAACRSTSTRRTGSVCSPA